jgi:signal transduction histidine kinase
MRERTDTKQLLAASRHWLIAVWTVGVAFTLTLAASPLVTPGISPLFLLAVMVSAWRGGLGPGLLATFLSTVASAFVFLPPAFSFQIDRSDLLQLVVFSLAAVIVGSLSASRKHAEQAKEVLLVKEQNARQEAEEANRVKDEFLAAVSHELRTPLTTIKTLTRVLQRRGMTENERQEYLADIASECDREIDLVLNLLDLSRVATSGVQIETKPTDAAAAISACERIMRGQAEKQEQNVSLKLDADLPPARADHSALRRALCAVAENAIKFTPPGGRIAFRAQRNGESILIEIEDDGRGIPPDDLPRVFEKFYRGRNAGGAALANTEDVPGIGLGLNLAQTLIEGMNGTIMVESVLGKGTKFVIRLPVWTERNGEPVFATQTFAIGKRERAKYE